MTDQSDPLAGTSPCLVVTFLDGGIDVMHRDEQMDGRTDWADVLAQVAATVCEDDAAELISQAPAELIVDEDDAVSQAQARMGQQVLQRAIHNLGDDVIGDPFGRHPNGMPTPPIACMVPSAEEVLSAWITPDYMCNHCETLHTGDDEVLIAHDIEGDALGRMLAKAAHTWASTTAEQTGENYHKLRAKVDGAFHGWTPPEADAPAGVQ